jgi:PAS domain S-box-containing protein
MIINISSLIPAIAFVPYILFTIFGLNQHKREGIRWSFIFYMFAMTVWSFGSFMMHAKTGVLDTLFWNRFMLVGLLGGPITIFHALLDLSGTQQKRYNYLLYIGYCIFGFLLFLNFSGHIVSDAWFENTHFYYDLAPRAPIAFVLCYSFLLFGIYILIKELKKADNPYLMRKLRLPLYGACIMLAGVLANLYEPLGRYPIDLFASTINAFFIFYAIYKYRLVNYSAFVLQAILYFILITVCAFLFYGVLYWIFPSIREVQLEHALLPLFLLGIIAAVVFEPIRTNALTLIEKLYFGKRFTYYKNLGTFLGDLTTIVELENLGETTVDKAINIFSLEWALMLVLDYSTWNYRISSQHGIAINDSFLQEFSLKRNDAFIAMISQHPGPLLRQNSQITVPLQLPGNELYPSIVMPLRFKDRLNGCLVLGRCTEKEYYDQFDIEILDILANQCSVALENAISFERLRRQQKKLQNLNQELSISRNKLEAFFDGITTPISIQDINYNIIMVNYAGARYCGMSYESVIGKKCYSVFFKRNKPCESCMAQDCLYMQIPFRTELNDTITDATFAIHFYPINVPEGSQKIFLEFFQDITQQKQLQKELAQSEKLAGIGSLASGIAHEINNPLTGIIGTAEILKDEVTDYTDLSEYVDDIINYAQNAAEVISELKAYARKENHEIEEVNISEVLETSLKLAARGMQLDAIDIQKDYNDSLSLEANSLELQQVFLNLIINAVQAMEGKGVLTIACKKIQEHAYISIIDTGRGIEKKSVEKIFNPFFTTKDPQQGMGLGLSITHQIVTNMGGRITVKSKPNHGTEFTILLPLTGDEKKRIHFIHATTEQHMEDVFFLQRKILVGEKGYLEETIRRDVDERAFHILAYRGLQPVGTISCITPEMVDNLPIEQHFPLNGEKQGKRCIEIDRLAVIREERGNIVPLGLMSLAYLYAKTENVEKLFLDVFSDEKKYISMYRKLGFHKVGEYQSPLPVTVMTLDYMTDYERTKMRMEQFVKPFMKRLLRFIDFEGQQKDKIVKAAEAIIHRPVSEYK